MGDPQRDTLADLDAQAAVDGGLVPPPAPAAEPETEPVPEPKILDLAEDTEAEAIRAGVEAFREFDVARRTRIMRQPVSALRRGNRIENLTQAAMILLAELDEAQRDAVLEIARENSWPVWVVMLGSVARSADLQELASGEMSDKWLNTPEKSEHVALSDPKCQRCGGTIPGARRGQAFCCNRHGSGLDQHNDDCKVAYMVFNGQSWIDTRR